MRLHESQVRQNPLYAITVDFGGSGPIRYAATPGDLFTTTEDVGQSRKFNTVPDAVLWMEQHQGKYGNAVLHVAPVVLSLSAPVERQTDREPEAVLATYVNGRDGGGTA